MRISIFFGVIMTIAITNISIAAEPNVEIAKTWWPELTNVITPVGWRDHFHRFNIVYEGSIIARPPQKPPQGNDDSDPLAGVQLAFSPSSEGDVSVSTTQRFFEAVSTTQLLRCLILAS